MYVHRFVDLLKQWITDVDHPGVTQVRTCLDVGRWEQPVGVMLDLSDGWRFLLQANGTSPDGGDAARDDEPPARFAGDWQGRYDYQQNRKAFEAEVQTWDGGRSKRPQATVGSLLAVVVEAIKRADHPKVASVDIPDGRLVVKVTFTDTSAVYGLPVGYLPPGAADFGHKVYEIPKEWC